MREHPNLVQSLIDSGHEIGNHTWSHPDLTKIDDTQVRRELQETGSLITQYVPRTSSPWWRAPFGARNRRVLRIANDLGYISIYWTLDSLDSVPPPKSSAFLVDRITGRSDTELEGAIILMHVGESASAEALPEILNRLERRGFEVVTISRLLDSSGASNK